MENKDRELVLELMVHNKQLSRLHDEHEKLELELKKYSTKVYLTEADQIEEKRLKKEKLRGVDEMMIILRNHRASEVKALAA